MMPVKKLKSVCETKRLFFVGNWNIDRSCFSRSKISLNQTNLNIWENIILCKNVFASKSIFYMSSYYHFCCFTFKNTSRCLFKYLKCSGVIWIKKKHFCLLVARKKYLRRKFWFRKARLTCLLVFVILTSSNSC